MILNAFGNMVTSLGKTPDQPSASHTYALGTTSSVLLFHTIVTFRDPDSGQLLAGRVVGRTSEGVPRYDVRVGLKIYADIPAPRISAVGSRVIPLLAKRLP